jgi:cellulose synthase/poly-beta-1,6-N-acetylglucosamine synthase-like glycosyltransferase
MVSKFCIVIPVKEMNDYLLENVPYIQSLEYRDWELLIIPNDSEENQWADPRIKIVPSGPVGPAVKRDLGAQISESDIIVFLDDDSYPRKDLLNVLDEAFLEAEVSAVGGPAITPDSDSFLQKVSGAVFVSALTGGSPSRYVSKGKNREVDDWPSVNLAVRRSVFREVGGFDSIYWPGEDTEFCLKLKDKGFKILYRPDAIVWHHRRSGLKAHLIQVGNYGLHRGYFARHLPGNSRKIKYFLPSFISLLILSSPLIYLLSSPITIAWTVLLLGYLLTVLLGTVDSMRYVSPLVALAAIPYVLLTHIAYGFRFLVGFLKSGALISKLR